MIRQHITTSLKAAKQRIKRQRPKPPPFKVLMGHFTRNHKSKKVKIGIISAALIALFIVSIILFSANDIFAIKTVKCYINDQICPKSYSNLLTNVPGGNLLNFKTEQFRRNIQNLNPIVKDVQVTKQIPQTIQFKFTLRKPIAVIIDKNMRTFYIDDSSKIFSQSDHPDVAHIFLDESVAVGENAVSSKLTGSMDIIYAMEDSFIPVKSIDSRHGSYAEVILHTGQIILMDFEKDKYKQVDALQLILQNSKIVSQDQPIKTIDLRYDSPIIR